MMVKLVYEPRCTHPDDLEMDLEHRRRLIAGEEDTYLREKRYFRSDGSIVWVYVSVASLRKADGSLDYFISIIEDVSDRKQAEDKLRASEEQFRLAMKNFRSSREFAVPNAADSSS